MKSSDTNLLIDKRLLDRSENKNDQEIEMDAMHMIETGPFKSSAKSKLATAKASA